MQEKPESLEQIENLLNSFNETVEKTAVALENTVLYSQERQEEIDDLTIKYGGVKDLNGKPGALFVIDVIGDMNAIKEAKTLGIPVVAIVDSNANPTLVDYVIPGNDDAIKGVQLILDYVRAAIAEGATSNKPVEKAEATDKKEK